MRKGALVLHPDRDLDFGLAPQKKSGEPPLDQLEARLRRHDLSNAATFLFNIERVIFLAGGQFVEDIGESGRLHAEENGKTIEALNEFKTG